MPSIFENRIARLDALRPLCEVVRFSANYKAVEYLMENGQWVAHRFNQVNHIERSMLQDQLVKASIIDESDLESYQYLLEKGIYKVAGTYTKTKDGHFKKITIF